jgi:hypothetical protein
MEKSARAGAATGAATTAGIVGTHANAAGAGTEDEEFTLATCVEPFPEDC